MNNLQETPAKELRKIWSGPHFLNKIFNKICQKGHWVYKREGFQVGKDGGGGGGVGKNWTQNEIAIDNIFIFSRLFDINDSRNDRNCHFNCQEMKNCLRKQSTTSKDRDAVTANIWEVYLYYI